MAKEPRHTNRAKEVFYCVNCKFKNYKSMCDSCVISQLENGKTTVPSNYVEELVSGPTKGWTIEFKDDGYDMVNHPEHYQMKDNTYEPYKVINAWDLDFNLGSVLKYIARAGKKPGEDAIRDLNKCKEYIDFEIMKLTKEKDN